MSDRVQWVWTNVTRRQRRRPRTECEVDGCEGRAVLALFAGMTAVRSCFGHRWLIAGRLERVLAGQVVDELLEASQEDRNDGD